MYLVINKIDGKKSEPQQIIHLKKEKGENIIDNTDAFPI